VIAEPTPFTAPIIAIAIPAAIKAYSMAGAPELVPQERWKYCLHAPNNLWPWKYHGRFAKAFSYVKNPG